jgi:hypothetical protein
VPLVVTHSDLVPGNVLVSSQGRPWIVDWDDAGPWNAAEEVAAAVVSWATGPQGEPDARVALALVEGYRRAGGTFTVGSPTVLAASLSAMANWLELNVRCGLSSAADARGRVQAETEVVDALGNFYGGGPGSTGGQIFCVDRQPACHGLIGRPACRLQQPEQLATARARQLRTSRSLLPLVR